MAASHKGIDARLTCCGVEGCEMPRASKGYCAKHATRLRRYGSPTHETRIRRRSRPVVECLIDGCDQTAKAKGLCSSHYSRMRLKGDAGAAVPIRSYDAREWFNQHKSYESDDCLIWTDGGRKTLVVSIAVLGEGADERYGQAKMNVGRAMCILVHGDPPTPKHVAAHWCGNGHLGCVNPQHLRWTTQQGNMADKALHGVRTHAGRDFANDAQIRAIRELAAVMPLDEIAAAFRVGPGVIRRITDT